MMVSTKKDKVVIIGGEGTPWPIKNAAWVANAGFDTHVLCFSTKPSDTIPQSVHIIQQTLQITLRDRIVMMLWFTIVLFATALGWFRFRLKMGRNPLFYDMPLADNPIIAKKKACIIDQLNPDIIIAHNLTSTGLTLTKTHTGKKVAIGWGADFTESFHSSLLNRFIYRSICKKTDLFICASQTALDFLGTTFSIDNHKLLRSDFVDNQIAELSKNPRNTQKIRSSMEIPPNVGVVFNARRFKPLFGGPQGFLGCIKVAKQRDDIWFIFIEGRNNKKWFDQCQRKLNRLDPSISSRFIMERGELPFSRVMDIFSVADVFLSLRKKGDMRAATVIQGAAMGVVPVLSSNTEWEMMKKNGFDAFLVDPDDSNKLVNTILQALDTPKGAISKNNRVYLEKHESDEIYFERFATALRKLVE